MYACACICVWRGVSGIVLADYRKHGGFERCNVSAAHNRRRQLIPCLCNSEHEKMFPKVMSARLFSDFVSMPTCVRNMEIKKVLKVAVVKMINDLMSIYQVSCQTSEF